MDQADTTTTEHYDYKCRAFIKNIDSEIKEEFLLSHLKQAGKVLTIKYHVDPVTSNFYLQTQPNQMEKLL